jgi:hypothetical protein
MIIGERSGYFVQLVYEPDSVHYSRSGSLFGLRGVSWKRRVENEFVHS